MIRLVLVVVTAVFSLIALVLGVLSLLAAGWLVVAVVVLGVTAIVLALAKGARLLCGH